MAEPASALLDELADLIGREPDARVSMDDGGLQVRREQTNSRLSLRRVHGVGVDAGVRYPAVDVMTTLNGNVTAPSTPRMRAYRLNPQCAIGAVQSHSPRGAEAVVLGSRICIDSEVPWAATGRHLVRLVVMEAGSHLFFDSVAGQRTLERAGMGVWRNSIQGIRPVETDNWRVLRRTADSLWAQPLGWPAVRGARIGLAVQGNNARVGRGLDYSLQIPADEGRADRLAEACDALNRQEWQNATGAPHIGAWSVTQAGQCCYRASVPARLGRRMPDLPRQLLATSGARANAAIRVLAMPD